MFDHKYKLNGLEVKHIIVVFQILEKSEIQL